MILVILDNQNTKNKVTKICNEPGIYFNGFNQTVKFNDSLFLLHFLKEEDKPAEDEVLKILVYFFIF